MAEKILEITHSKVKAAHDVILPDEGKGSIKAIVTEIAKAWKGYTEDIVVEKDVVTAAFDIYVSLFRADMTGVVIDAVDSLMEQFLKEIEIWGRSKEARAIGIDVNDALKPVQVRQLLLTEIKSVFMRRWQEQTFKPNRVYSSATQVMEEMQWIKHIKDEGYDAVVTWKDFFDYISGYDRKGNIYVEGASIFGGPDGGLINDLHDKCREKLRDIGLIAIWNKLYEDIVEFDQKDDWQGPEGYQDLGDCINNLSQDMSEQRKIFTRYVEEVELIQIEELTKRIDNAENNQDMLKTLSSNNQKKIQGQRLKIDGLISDIQRLERLFDDRIEEIHKELKRINKQGKKDNDSSDQK